MDHNLELKRERYGLLKQGCMKGMELQDGVHAKLFLVVWALFLGLLLGSIFLGPLGFYFFTNPIFGFRAILIIWILFKFQLPNLQQDP